MTLHKIKKIKAELGHKIKSKTRKYRKINERPNIPQVLLAILYATGKIGVEITKAFFPHPYYHAFCSHYHKESAYHALKRLANKKLVQKNKNGIFKLTKSGEKEAFFAYINAEVNIKKSNKKTAQHWDNKWRIIFFDIPEKIKEKREYLRSIIKALGFRELQKSVWILPYEVPEFLLEILKEEKMLQYTRFVLTESISYDLDIKSRFSLH